MNIQDVLGVHTSLLLDTDALSFRGFEKRPPGVLQADFGVLSNACDGRPIKANLPKTTN